MMTVSILINPGNDFKVFSTPPDNPAKGVELPVSHVEPCLRMCQIGPHDSSQDTSERVSETTDEMETADKKCQQRTMQSLTQGP